MRVTGFAIGASVAGWMALAGAAFGQGLTREGGYWVRTLSGYETVPDNGRMRISVSGDVTVTGTAASEFTYVLKARVKAGSEAAARALLESYVVRVLRPRRDSVVAMAPAGRGLAEFHLKVPRRVRELALSTNGGAIELYDLTGPVQAVTGGGRLKADRIHGGLFMRTAGGDVSLGTIEGAVRVATAGGPITAGVIQGEAILETGAGDIVAKEVHGPVRASTAGGSIRILRAGSTVMASTGGGRIEVDEARGQVQVKNSGGPVRVGAAAGVWCENAAGGIRLSNVSGSLRASTALGSIVAQVLAGSPFLDSFLTTGSGDITVFIPSNLGLRIYALNEVSGSTRRIVSDFPGLNIRTVGGQVIAEGALNGGGPLLRLAGTGGTIFIKRQ